MHHMLTGHKGGGEETKSRTWEGDKEKKRKVEGLKLNGYKEARSRALLALLGLLRLCMVQLNEDTKVDTNFR